ncbi:hypothetical protein BU23DRAFT_445899 [Bimuria novae-zelandiae CBS 107.79]|uniref:Chitin synthesis regulation, congo red resistance, RCR protein n=1 Tax=Bimuria novae-zelandiae CBS 107.79 TaxID=1447943 RepID=A0A6A5VSF3_9PLEO|nr:hypothetical protein BU23DRAFT_445899 [Bimuria novae-zelandiae CBS 107.79]
MARCYDRYTNRYYYCRSAWNDWVRWVVLAVIVVGFFLIFVLCSCLTARRRRKAGRQPFYGTGWAARPGFGNTAQPHYNNHYNQPPPPQYTPQPQHGEAGSYYGSNQGYYGNNASPYGQANGVELQQPPAAYQGRGGEDVYSPPPGPPPGKA